jgi:hypothetical protein
MMLEIPTACQKLRTSFSAYLDGAVPGKEMQQIAAHLDQCAECSREFESLRAMQRTLSVLGPARPPADLGLKLRLAISHANAQKKAGWLDGLSLMWDNTIRPVALQFSAGLAGAIVLIGGIGLLLGMVAAPEPVMANDEPLGAMTSPHYLYSVTSPSPIVTDHDAVIVVEALVNSQGKVYDYNIVSGPADAAVRKQVVDQLLMSVYQPASVFDAPIRSRVVLTFSGISVRG